MASDGKQNSLSLRWGVLTPPKDAPAKVLRQVESEAQAVAVSMAGKKLAYLAACLGRSESYLSRIRNGRRPVPDWMVQPFCNATGSNLLAQFRALQDALSGEDEAAKVRRLASMLREVA